MKENNCEFEERIVKGAMAKSPNQKIATHLAQCADCREALRVAGWMQTFAATSEPKNLPKPGFIRWKAQIVEKQAAANRATKPMMWAQTFTVVSVAATVVWLLFGNHTGFSTTFQALFESFELVAAPFLICFVCAAFVCLTFFYKWREPSKK